MEAVKKKRTIIFVLILLIVIAATAAISIPYIVNAFLDNSYKTYYSTQSQIKAIFVDEQNLDDYLNTFNTSSNLTVQEYQNIFYYHKIAMALETTDSFIDEALGFLEYNKGYFSLKSAFSKASKNLISSYEVVTDYIVSTFDPFLDASYSNSELYSMLEYMNEKYQVYVRDFGAFYLAISNILQNDAIKATTVNEISLCVVENIANSANILLAGEINYQTAVSFYNTAVAYPTTTTSPVETIESAFAVFNGEEA